MTVREKFPFISAILTGLALASCSSPIPPSPTSSKPEISEYTTTCLLRLEPSLRSLVQSATKEMEDKRLDEYKKDTGLDINELTSVYRFSAVSQALHSCANAEQRGESLDQLIASEETLIAHSVEKIPEDVNFVLRINRIIRFKAAAEQFEKTAASLAPDSNIHAMFEGMVEGARKIVEKTCVKIVLSSEEPLNSLPELCIEPLSNFLKSPNPQ